MKKLFAIVLAFALVFSLVGAAGASVKVAKQQESVFKNIETFYTVSEGPYYVGAEITVTIEFEKHGSQDSDTEWEITPDGLISVSFPVLLRSTAGEQTINVSETMRAGKSHVHFVASAVFTVDVVARPNEDPDPVIPEALSVVDLTATNAYTQGRNTHYERWGDIYVELNDGTNYLYEDNYRFHWSHEDPTLKTWSFAVLYEGETYPLTLEVSK